MESYVVTDRMNNYYANRYIEEIGRYSCRNELKIDWNGVGANWVSTIFENDCNEQLKLWSLSCIVGRVRFPLLWKIETNEKVLYTHTHYILEMDGKTMYVDARIIM